MVSIDAFVKEKFRRLGKHRTEACRPLAATMIFNTPASRKDGSMRLAVSAGIPAVAIKSALLKIGRSKIQPRTWMAYWDRVS
ncbi:MAG: hypothetical protein WC799_24980 [Desulfobacteraceae bacterium]